jgi:hypothetical protein
LYNSHEVQKVLIKYYTIFYFLAIPSPLIKGKSDATLFRGRIEMERDLLQEVKDLGIIGITANGDMTPELIACAIDSTKELFTLIDTDAIAKYIDEMYPEEDSLLNDDAPMRPSLPHD